MNGLPKFVSWKSSFSFTFLNSRDSISKRSLRFDQPKREELVLDRELRRQELVDEGDVVVERAHLEDLFAPEPEPQIPVPLRVEVVALLPLAPELPLVPALLDVAVELDAELVRVEPPAARRHDARVVVGVVDDLAPVADVSRSSCFECQ